MGGATVQKRNSCMFLHLLSSFARRSSHSCRERNTTLHSLAHYNVSSCIEACSSYLWCQGALDVACRVHRERLQHDGKTMNYGPVHIVTELHLIKICGTSYNEALSETKGFLRVEFAFRLHIDGENSQQSTSRQSTFLYT
ncbi:hypothetical protein MPSEU_000633600 [Mayamaea pseudoterrestris]|nr:hypothetical protein MPSEU_000633600 [Mayamaea pseudoterrestris]